MLTLWSLDCLTSQGVVAASVSSSEVANANNSTLYNGDVNAVLTYPVYSDSDWNSNFWQGGPPWTNYDNVCAAL